VVLSPARLSYLTILAVALVATQNNRNAITDARQILVPLRYILVGDARRHVKHDDRCLTSDVVSIA
jgi:hypothetical protein